MDEFETMGRLLNYVSFMINELSEDLEESKGKMMSDLESTKDAFTFAFNSGNLASINSVLPKVKRIQEALKDECS